MSICVSYLWICLFSPSMFCWHFSRVLLVILMLIDSIHTLSINKEKYGYMLNLPCQIIQWEECLGFFTCIPYNSGSTWYMCNMSRLHPVYIHNIIWCPYSTPCILGDIYISNIFVIDMFTNCNMIAIFSWRNCSCEQYTYEFW